MQPPPRRRRERGVTVSATAARRGIHTRPAELLRNLIRFDTTNPPGNERECISYIDGLLSEAGIETTIRARDPERPNLIARLPGRGAAPPLLLYGHVDVVTTAGQTGATAVRRGRADGYIWGRGRGRHEGRRRDDAVRVPARASGAASSRRAT